MIIEPVHHMKGDLSQLVAIDMIGAGVGEYVLVAQGSAARIGCGVETAPEMPQLSVLLMTVQDWSNAMEIKELQDIIQQNGVVGAGGAGFCLLI